MRNTIKSLVALLIVFSAADVFAKIDTASAVRYCKVVAQGSSESYKLIYNGVDQENVVVTWTDKKNTVIYKESFYVEGMIKQYDLSALPDGDYTFTLVSADFTYTEEVKLGDLSDFHFHIREDEKNVILTGYQPDGKDVTVIILDDNDNMIFTESLEETKEVQKKYNFEKMNADEVTFILSHDNKIFKEEKVSF